MLADSCAIVKFYARHSHVSVCKLHIVMRKTPPMACKRTSVMVPAVPTEKVPVPETVPWPELGSGQAVRLKWSRDRLGWSLADLASASGVSIRTIREIESGKKAGTSADVMAALADALRVSRGWLAFGG